MTIDDHHPPRIINVMLAGVVDAGRKAGLVELDWMVTRRPNWAEIAATTRNTTPDAQGDDVARQWADLLELREVDPHLAGTTLYVGVADPITVAITGITDTALWRQGIDISLP